MLRDAGVTAEVRVHPWKRPVYDVLGHLQDLETNRAEAVNVARMLGEYRRGHPAARIDLVGYSGGGGQALLVAEALADDVRPFNIVLVQPGVSPTWDLTTTLRKIDGQVINFCCATDWFILGAGTKVFGTIDRKKVAAAGKNGFDVAAAVPDPAQRERLVQRPWTREMLRRGHIGNHLSMMLYAWNREYVAPYLLRTATPASGAGQ